jgi:transposase
MITPDVIGCDIAKAHLDLFDSGCGRHCRIFNTPEAISAWLASLKNRTVHVVFEATGRYDGRLRAALEAAGHPYSRVNPARARDFARALGLLAKTDVIDAQLLARMGQSLPLATQAPDDPARRSLARLHGRRDQLVAIRQQERTRLHEAEGGERTSLESHLVWLDTEITRIEMLCRERLRADEELYRQEQQLRSIPGVGPVAALTLMTLMPELGSRGPKAMAALAAVHCAANAISAAAASGCVMPSIWQPFRRAACNRPSGRRPRRSGDAAKVSRSSSSPSPENCSPLPTQ